MLALVACCHTHVTLQAQESHQKFTLTDGRLWWMDASVCDESRKYTVAFDENNRWAKAHVYGNINVTEFVEQGERYLKLRLDTVANEAPAPVPGTHIEPRLVAKAVEEGFDPYCVWTRTGSTGYYYQEWGEYRYYLVGSPDTLKVVQVGIGDALDDATYWYDWDFGCGITDVNYVNGVRKETTHWIYYDTVGRTAPSPKEGQWKMVPQDCYQRPEDVIYHGWTNDPSVDDANKRYYYTYRYDPWTQEEMENDGRSLSVPDEKGFYHDGRYHAYGNGALYLPVTQKEHPTDIVNYNVRPKTTVYDSLLSYGDTTTVKLDLNPTRAVDAQVRPAYTEYIEEKKRCGINLDYTQRDTLNTFGKAGVPTCSTYYYQNGVKIATIPDLENLSLELATVTFHMDPKLRRYLELYGDDEDKSTIHDTTLVIDNTVELDSIMHVRSYSIPARNITAPLSLYLKFRYVVSGDTNYAYDTLRVTLTASSDVNTVEIEDPMFSPVIYGYVCGGGRMANVGWDNGSSITGGDTKITIHNTDTTYAVYGGNDIAGWVQGSATIQVGTLSTVTPLRLGYLYGGGCGYYSYGEPFDAVKAATDGVANSWADTITRTVGYGQYCFKGKVYPWNYTFQSYDPVNDPVDPNAAYVIADGFDYNPYDGDDFAHGEKGQGFVDDKMSGTVPYIKTSHIIIGVPVGYTEDAAATDAEALAALPQIQDD